MENSKAPAQGTCNCKQPRPGYKFIEIPVDKPYEIILFPAGSILGPPIDSWDRDKKGHQPNEYVGGEK